MSRLFINLWGFSDNRIGIFATTQGWVNPLMRRSIFSIDSINTINAYDQ